MPPATLSATHLDLTLGCILPAHSMVSPRVFKTLQLVVGPRLKSPHSGWTTKAHFDSAFSRLSYPLNVLRKNLPCQPAGRLFLSVEPSHQIASLDDHAPASRHCRNRRKQRGALNAYVALACFCPTKTNFFFVLAANSRDMIFSTEFPKEMSLATAHKCHSVSG